jgi:aryl-alcohol dehydrogenase-like predicted oxidoreductase
MVIVVKNGEGTLEIRRLGRGELRVTALGLGGAGFGGSSYGAVSDDEAVETVRAAIDGGITHIDTSPLYGESERRLGLALQGVRRDRLIISTKVGTHPKWRGDYSADATYLSVENSLRLLGTEYIDLLLVHDPPTLDQALGPAGAFEALEQLKAQQVIRAIGLGVRSHALLEQAIRSDRVDVILTFLDYTLLRTSAADVVLPLAAAHDVGVINGSPLAMGLLSGGDPDRYLETAMPWVGQALQGDLPAARRMWRLAREHGIDLQALALQWSMRERRIGGTLAGGKTAAEVRRNIEAATAPLPEGIWEEVETVRAGLEAER